MSRWSETKVKPDLVTITRASFEVRELQELFNLATDNSKLIELGLLKVSVKTNQAKPIKFFRIDLFNTVTAGLIDFKYVAPAELGIEEFFEFDLQEAKCLSIFQ